MKLKKWILATLLTVLPIMTIYAQQFQANNQIYENELEIDLNKTYSGSEVNELIKIILEEADNSIEKAYAEGYKQATLEYKPYTIVVDKPDKKKTFLTYSITFTSGVCIGFLTSIAIDKIISKRN